MILICEPIGNPQITQHNEIVELGTKVRIAQNSVFETTAENEVLHGENATFQGTIAELREKVALLKKISALAEVQLEDQEEELKEKGKELEKCTAEKEKEKEKKKAEEEKKAKEEKKKREGKMDILISVSKKIKRHQIKKVPRWRYPKNAPANKTFVESRFGMEFAYIVEAFRIGTENLVAYFFGELNNKWNFSVDDETMKNDVVPSILLPIATKWPPGTKDSDFIELYSWIHVLHGLDFDAVGKELKDALESPGSFRFRITYGHVHGYGQEHIDKITNQQDKEAIQNVLSQYPIPIATGTLAKKKVFISSALLLGYDANTGYYDIVLIPTDRHSEKKSEKEEVEETEVEGKIELTRPAPWTSITPDVKEKSWWATEKSAEKNEIMVMERKILRQRQTPAPLNPRFAYGPAKKGEFEQDPTRELQGDFKIAWLNEKGEFMLDTQYTFVPHVPRWIQGITITEFGPPQPGIPLQRVPVDGFQTIWVYRTYLFRSGERGTTSVIPPYKFGVRFVFRTRSQEISSKKKENPKDMIALTLSSPKFTATKDQPIDYDILLYVLGISTKTGTGLGPVKRGYKNHWEQGARFDEVLGMLPSPVQDWLHIVRRINKNPRIWVVQFAYTPTTMKTLGPQIENIVVKANSTFENPESTNTTIQTSMELSGLNSEDVTIDQQTGESAFVTVGNDFTQKNRVTEWYDEKEIENIKTDFKNKILASAEKTSLKDLSKAPLDFENRENLWKQHFISSEVQENAIFGTDPFYDDPFDV